MNVISEEKHIFHTELGCVLVTTKEVTDYDIEDIVRDGAISEATRIKFENLAALVDINALQGPRTIQSSYVTKG